jgi:WD40 repeat protein
MKNIFILSVLLLLSISTWAQVRTELITQEKNLGIITSIEYSPNGKYIASGSDKDNSIKIWDVQTGKLIGTLKGHTSHINDFDFSPNGLALASAAQDKKLYIWDLEQWTIKDSVAHKSSIKHVKYMSDLDLYFSDNHGAVHFTNLTSTNQAYDYKGHIQDLTTNSTQVIVAVGKEIHILKDGADRTISHNAEVVAIKVNDQSIVVADKKGMIAIYSLEGTKDMEFKAHDKSISAFDVDFVGKQVVTTSADKTTKIWSLKGTEVSTELNYGEEKAPEEIKAVKFSPDGNTLASSAFTHSIIQTTKSKDNSIKIWNVETGRIYKELKGAVNPIQTFCFHHSQNILYTVQSDMLSVWDLDFGERGVEVELHEREIIKESVAAKVDKNVGNGKALKGFKKLKGLATGTIGIGDLGAKEKAKGQTGKLAAAAARKRFISTDRIYVSNSGNQLITQFLKDEIRLYEFTDNVPLHLKRIETHQETRVNDISIDPTDKYFALAGSGDHAITIVNLETGNYVRTLSTEKADAEKGDFMECRALSFDTKGNRLSALFNTGLIMVWDVATWERLFRVDLKGGLSKHAFLNYTKDGKYFSVPSLLGVLQVDATLLVPLTTKQPKIKGKPMLTHNASDYIVSVEGDHLNFLNVVANTTVSSINLSTDLITSIEFNQFGFLGVGLKTGELILLDPETGKERFTMVSSGENAIFKTDENYYKITKEGAALVTFRVGHEAFPFEQFDAKFNRPDLVLKAMKSNEEGLINLYHNAYKKRLSKLGVKESDLGEDMLLPESKVLNAKSIPLITAESQIKLAVESIEHTHNLKQFNVWVNDVPVYGSAGKAITGKNVKTEVNVQLVSGINKIQVSCINSKGFESLKHTFDVDCTVKSKSDLYVVTVGTSAYKNSDFNLNYAAKDANDIAALFESKKGQYENVHRKTLTDADVLKGNFADLKKFLIGAKVNDVVIVFIAGHGVLDSKLDYYYGTHNIDFTNPAADGLKYNNIEAILDGIKPLKKILIMDTCHSGEVEEEEVEAADAPVESTDVVFRAVGPGLKQKEGASPTRMMNELFNDLRRGTGSTVIASAGGAEYAMESDSWKNGLFTYCFIDGLKNNKADLNSDGKIMLSELQTYVRGEVLKLSNGAQEPTTRIQNIALDYQVW